MRFARTKALPVPLLSRHFLTRFLTLFFTFNFFLPLVFSIIAPPTLPSTLPGPLKHRPKFLERETLSYRERDYTTNRSFLSSFRSVLPSRLAPVTHSLSLSLPAMAPAASERMELAKLCGSRDWSRAIRVLDSLLAQSCAIQDLWFVFSDLHFLPIPIPPSNRCFIFL